MKEIKQSDYNELFWKKIDIARRNRKMSNAELARQVGISRTHYLEAKQKKRLFQVARVFTLCDVLNISMDELCDPDIEIKPNYTRKVTYYRRPEDLEDQPKWSINAD